MGPICAHGAIANHAGIVWLDRKKKCFSLVLAHLQLNQRFSWTALHSSTPSRVNATPRTSSSTKIHVCFFGFLYNGTSLGRHYCFSVQPNDPGMLCDRSMSAYAWDPFLCSFCYRRIGWSQQHSCRAVTSFEI